MSFKKILLLIFILTLGLKNMAAQEEMETELEEASEGKHSLAFVLSHTYIGGGLDESGDKTFKTVPSFALDYNYWFSEKFALGLHTDFLNENFVVESEDEEGELIERERPIAPVIMGTYSPWEHWNFGLGFGGEFASGETYFVTRMSVEYVVEIHNGWAVLGGLTHDFRSNIYNATSLGIGIEKRFGK